MAVEHSMDSINTFLVPSMLGLFILIISWVCSFFQHRKCYPSSKYFLLNCLPGLAIGGAGLASSIFLSSSEYTHAAWHVARGVAVVIMLPQGMEREGMSLYFIDCHILINLIRLLSFGYLSLTLLSSIGFLGL